MWTEPVRVGDSVLWGWQKLTITSITMNGLELDVVPQVYWDRHGMTPGSMFTLDPITIVLSNGNDCTIHEIKVNTRRWE